VSRIDDSHSRDPHAVHRVDGLGADALDGHLRWSPVNSLWNGGMLVAAVGFAPFHFTPGALLLGLATTAVGLLLGHSVGYHRLLIHRSFACPRWLERLFLWAGALVGMAGPIGIIRQHDLRDWAQRQPECHPYLSQHVAWWRDAWWQLHCRLELARPPQLYLGDDDGRFNRWLEASWRWQQLPVAAVLWCLGGLPFLLWGVAVRICLSATGHWLVGWLAHNRGPQRWLVDASGVQAFDVPWAAIPTMGEAWHNNHHAYPGSARIGLEPGQSDIGFGFIQMLSRFGLAWNIQTPDTMGERPGLSLL
jgi:fatty-acid desaturase